MANKRYKLTFDLYDGTTKSVVFEVPQGDPPSQEQIRRAVEDYMAENQIPSESVDLTGVVKSVNGAAPDENGNVEITIPDSGGNVDYVLPVGGAELGGVKNGGNVVINADGTMTAPTGSGSSGGGMTSTEKNALLIILDAVIVEANKQPIVAEALATLRQLWSGGEVFVSQNGTTLAFENVTAITSITQNGAVLALA